jgi:Domain of unknown function (DUF4371)
LRRGWAFRGHDESENSSNAGNFIEIMRFLRDRNEEIKSVILDNAPQNRKFIAPTIQKDIANACAEETNKEIIAEFGDGLFFVMVKNYKMVCLFFQKVNGIRNVVGASCKRLDQLREMRKINIMEAISNEEISIGSGLNQKMDLARSCDTRWISHYKILTNLLKFFRLR